MRLVVVLFLLVLSCHTNAHAQQVTPTSTAEECVRFIDNLIKTGDGRNEKYNYIQKSSFTGGALVVQEDWKYFKTYDTRSNINWAGFKEIRTTEPDGGLAVVISFNANNISREKKYVDIETGLITPEDYNSEATDRLYFKIPLSEKGKIKDLELAANRLKKIVEEKGNIFPASGSPSIKIPHIEGKPSYKETVEYIDKFLEDANKNNLFCNTVTFDRRSTSLGMNSSGATLLLSSYSWEGRATMGSPKKTEKFRINISEVEDIRIVTGEGFAGGCLQVGLWFVEKGKSATPVMHLPLWKAAFDTYNSNEFKETQIYKAFNHLRQLTGAPEPLKFD